MKPQWEVLGFYSCYTVTKNVEAFDEIVDKKGQRKGVNRNFKYNNNFT